MSGLRFENEAAVATALGAALIPPDVAVRRVRFARVPSDVGSAVIIEATGLSASQITALEHFGAATVPMPLSPSTAPFWAAIVRPRKSPLTCESVLFVDRRKSMGLSLATELVVKGGERVELASFEGGALVRATRPSHYVVQKALDGDSRLRAYAPCAGTNSGVWIALGHAHDALTGIRAAPGDLVLVDGDGGVEVLHPSEFRAVWNHLEIVLEQAPAKAPITLPRRTIALTLRRAVTTKVPTLWVVRENTIRAMEELAENTPESILRRLSFVAWGERTSPTVAIRTDMPTSLFPGGDAYAPLAELPDVFIPADRRIHPPVWSDRLRDVVGGPDDRIRWLHTQENGAVAVESARLVDFSPLLDWIELSAETSVMQTWVRAVTFEPSAFEIFVGEPVAPIAEAPEAIPDDVVPRRRRRSTVASATSAPPMRATVERGTPTASRPRAELRPIPPDDALLVEREAALAAATEPLASPSHDQRWLELSRLYSLAQLEREAVICRARLVFGGSDLADDAVADWIETRPRDFDVAAALSSGLAEPTTLTTIVGELVAAESGAAKPPDLSLLSQGFELLERQGASLCVRSQWLGMRAIAKLASEDELLLARARDTVFARILDGLSLSRDLPRAVRRADGNAASERQHALLDVLSFLEKNQRSRSTTEAPLELTRAYIRLIFAIGLARAGDRQTAEGLGEQARAALPSGDPVHAVLSGWFLARLRMALDGEPESAPAPVEVLDRYEALGRLERYKVDRVRQCVKLLDPETDLDAFRAFGRGSGDPVLALVRAINTARTLSEKERILDDAWKAAVACSGPSVTTVLGALTACPTRISAPRLAQLGQLVGSLDSDLALASLLRAMPLAQRFDAREIADGIRREVLSRLPNVSPNALCSASEALARAARTLPDGLSTAAFSDALRNVRGRLVEGDARTAVARLALASVLDETAETRATTFDTERTMLSRGLAPAERLSIVRALGAYAVAVGRLDLVATLTSEWASTTDSYNTNSHLCLSAVELADAFAGALSPHSCDGISRARRLADQDERAVRAQLLEET